MTTSFLVKPYTQPIPSRGSMTSGQDSPRLPLGHSWGDPLLRRPAAADADHILTAFLSDPEMVRQGEVSNVSQAHTYIERLLNNPEIEAWAVSLGGDLVGLVCINIDEANRNGWFSYWMTREARGQGFTARAAATVADWALSNRELERLELGHRANNPASGSVALKAGFVLEGTERAKFLIDGERIDVLTYGRLRTDLAPPYEPLPFQSF